MQVNTNPVVFTSKVMHHVEGGWPKEVDFTEAEHVIRYRKKVRAPMRGCSKCCCTELGPSAQMLIMWVRAVLELL